MIRSDHFVIFAISYNQMLATAVKFIQIALRQISSFSTLAQLEIKTVELQFQYGIQFCRILHETDFIARNGLSTSFYPCKKIRSIARFSLRAQHDQFDRLRRLPAFHSQEINSRPQIRERHYNSLQADL